MRDNYSCRSVRYQSGAECAAVNAVCRGTHEPVEMLLRCNGEREPSWSTDGHSCGSPAARRNSAHCGGSARIEDGVGLIIHLGCD